MTLPQINALERSLALQKHKLITILHLGPLSLKNIISCACACFSPIILWLFYCSILISQGYSELITSIQVSLGNIFVPS